MNQIEKAKKEVAEQCNCKICKNQVCDICQKQNKPIPHSSVIEKFKLKLKWRKEHPKLAKLQDIWWWIRHGIWNKIIDFPSEVKYFIQRGKRGIADGDVWGFDHYLASVISKGTDKLIKNAHGYPSNLKNSRQWSTILRKISKTFKTAEKITSLDLIYLSTKKENKNRKKIIKVTREHNKEWDSKDKVMTEAENEAYKEGWALFQKYFFNLWD